MAYNCLHSCQIIYTLRVKENEKEWDTNFEAQKPNIDSVLNNRHLSTLDANFFFSLWEEEKKSFSS